MVYSSNGEVLSDDVTIISSVLVSEGLSVVSSVPVSNGLSAVSSESIEVYTSSVEKDSNPHNRNICIFRKAFTQTHYIFAFINSVNFLICNTVLGIFFERKTSAN